MKKKLVAAVVAATMGLAAMSAHANLKSITIGTNPSGSAFYLIGSGFAKLYQEKLKIRSTAQPYAGSSVYLPLVNSGDMTIGIASTIDSRLAYNGSADFNQKMTNLRTLGQIWKIPYAFITRADSGIKTADDLKGKTVMGDMPTSQALTLINEIIIESGGLTKSDLKFAKSGGLMDGINAVVEGRADAAPVATSMPVLVESNASTPGGLRIVANGSKGTAEFFETKAPGVTVGIAKPTEKQPFVIGETPITTYSTLLTVNNKMSDDDAYMLTKTLHQNWAQLQKDIGPLRALAAQDLAIQNPTVPYHPGAIRYYKEAGLWSADHEAAHKAMK